MKTHTTSFVCPNVQCPTCNANVDLHFGKNKSKALDSSVKGYFYTQDQSYNPV